MSRFKGLRKALIAGGLVVALMAVSTGPAAAQTVDSDAISAIASVLGLAPMNVTGVNDLLFGTVAAGAVGTIADTAANGGRWTVSGEPSHTVSVTFTLPTVLSGPGGTIPIAFSALSGIDWGDTYPGAHTIFNPNALYATSLTGAGTKTIGIVGAVSPPLGTTTGTYTAPITLTVAYTP